MTSLLRWTIRVHKWLALIVGIQIILWVTGGVVMSVIPIETVRGEHNIAEVIHPDQSGTRHRIGAGRLCGRTRDIGCGVFRSAHLGIPPDRAGLAYFICRWRGDASLCVAGNRTGHSPPEQRMAVL